MSQIKGEFQRKKRLENILHANKKFKTTSIAVPIVQEQEEDDLFYVSDDDDDAERDIESSREWRNLINEWIEMVQDEEAGMNQVDEEDEEENNEDLDLEPLIDCDMDLDQILRKQHPLINQNSKWKLGDIINFEKLHPPAYLSLLSKYCYFFI